MRRILIFYAFLCLTCSVQAQLSVSISGSCTYPDGTPVPDVDIFVSTVFNDSTFLFTNVLTDADGEFTETIPVPDGQIEGQISISAIGCNGVFDFATLNWNLEETVLVHDFIWCEIVAQSDSCFVLIIPNADPFTDVTTLYALNSALEPVAYLWSDGSTANSIIPTDTGMYCVTISGGDGCTTSGCYAYADGSEGCFVSISVGNGLNDTVLVAVGWGVAPMEYVWNSGDTGHTYVVHEEGTYCVTMTDAHGCGASTCTNYYQVAATSDEVRGTLKLFPQPAADRCYVEMPSPLAGKSYLIIADMNGYVIEHYGYASATATDVLLDLKGFVPGMYIVKLHSDQGTWLGKLIKQ